MRSLNDIIAALRGVKTYLAGGATSLAGVLMWLGIFTPEDAPQVMEAVLKLLEAGIGLLMALVGLIAIFGRAAIAKVGDSQ